jgi:hypothetical protein
MSQTIFSADEQAASPAGYMNVAENWVLYDTVLIGGYVNSLHHHDGYFASFALAGLANQIPFFNVRNRNHGLQWNNQDTRDQLPYVFEIYSIGVTFFGPKVACYHDAVGVPTAPQTTALHCFEAEVPKHTSLSLWTNQDERLKLASLMAPSGYGIVSGGVAQGDIETANTYLPVTHASFTQGQPVLTNKWGFPKPLQIPRRANLSVVLELSEYGRQLMQGMPGPFQEAFRDVANDNSYFFSWGMSGIQVSLGGRRQVQQRGEYHA